MTNIKLYSIVSALKDYLEDRQDHSPKQIAKAVELVSQVFTILERRSKPHA